MVATLMKRRHLQSCLSVDASTRNPITMRYGDPRQICQQGGGVHELGLTLGFGHDCQYLQCHGDAWRHLWANGPDAEVYIGEPLTSGLEDVYGQLGAPDLQSPDVSVSHLLAQLRLLCRRWI
jgi:hypothetical protein